MMNSRMLLPWCFWWTLARFIVRWFFWCCYGVTMIRQWKNDVGRCLKIVRFSLQFGNICKSFPFSLCFQDFESLECFFMVSVHLRRLQARLWIGIESLNYDCLMFMTVLWTRLWLFYVTFWCFCACFNIMGSESEIFLLVVTLYCVELDC
jgi:hypothetical protein